MNFTSKQEKELRVRVGGNGIRVILTNSRVGHCFPVGRIRYRLVGVVYMENLCHYNHSGGK